MDLLALFVKSTCDSWEGNQIKIRWGIPVTRAIKTALVTLKQSFIMPPESVGEELRQSSGRMA